MTKKDQIKKLLPLGLSNREIAERVGCSYGAVSHVKWTLSRPEQAEAYRIANSAKTTARHIERYHSDPDFRARRIREVREWQLANPERYRQISRDTCRRRKAYAEMKAKEARA